MSEKDYITKSLHLQDDKIIVNRVLDEIIKGIITTVIYVERHFEPHLCPDCNSDNVVIKDYYDRTIKHLDYFGFKSIIKYKQRRFKCNNCKKTFNERCNLIKKNYNSSNAVITKILEECRTKQSFKDIAKNINVSLPTVVKYFNFHVSTTRKTLTQTLCFDEFKASTNAGKYAFIIGDPISGEIIDIIKTRTQDFLYEYFNKIPLEERNQVKYIVTDLFEPYRSVIKNCFYNAVHIADRFHWIRMTTNSFNNLRIRIMKFYSKLGNETFNGRYNKYTTYAIRLKKYWKFLLKNKYQMKHEKYDVPSYNYTFKKDISIDDIIEWLVNKDSALEEGYSFLQDLYKISKDSNYESIKVDLKRWINTVENSIDLIPEFKEAITAYKNWFEEICNSFIINPITNKRMTNSFIEGKNNFCKVIKRIGFGYKNFDTYKARVLYTNSKNIKPFRNYK